MMMRLALSASVLTAGHAQLNAVVLIDNCNLISGTDLQTGFISTLEDSRSTRLHRASYVLTGLRRSMINLIPPDQEIFSRTKVINIDRTRNEVIEKFTRIRAERLGIETSDSTIELMSEQLNRTSFIRAQS
jgi:hypothetical protein